MRRPIAVILTVVATAGMLTGCGNDRKECEKQYIARQQQLTGIKPSKAEARDACDRDRRSGTGFYGGSRARGGGSGFGK